MTVMQITDKMIQYNNYVADGTIKSSFMSQYASSGLPSLTGSIDKQFTEAVINVQQAAGITVDGYFGPATKKAVSTLISKFNPIAINNISTGNKSFLSTPVTIPGAMSSGAITTPEGWHIDAGNNNSQNISAIPQQQQKKGFSLKPGNIVLLALLAYGFRKELKKFF